MDDRSALTRTQRLSLWGGFGVLCAVAFFLTNNVRLSFSSDHLYGALFAHFNTALFRTSPSTYLVPDVLLHYASRLTPGTFLEQVVVAGVLHFLLNVGGVTLVFGRWVGALFAVSLLYLHADMVLNTGMHLSLVFLFALYVGARRRLLKHSILLIASASDPLFGLIWLPVSTLTGRPVRTLPTFLPEYRLELALVAIGLAFSLFMSETNIELLRFSVVFFLGVVVQQCLSAFRYPRMLIHAYGAPLAFAGAGVCLFLAEFVATDLLAPRYLIPIGMSLALYGLYLTRPPETAQGRAGSRRERSAAAVVLCGSLAFGIYYQIQTHHDFFAIEKVSEPWKCAAEAITQRGVSKIAADHWLAKPLYVAALELEKTLDVVQVDFVNNMPDTWIAPYDFARGHSMWALRDDAGCRSQSAQNPQCAHRHERLPDHGETIAVCDRFIMIRFAEPIPDAMQRRRFDSVDGKLDGFAYNVRNNVDKALGRLDR